MQNIINEKEPYILYNQLMQLNNDGTYTFKDYKKDILRLKSGLEKSIKEKEINGIKKSKIKDRERYDNLSRTKTMILDYAANNEWHSFVTLTFGDNITDKEKANKIFNNYITKINRYLKTIGQAPIKYLGLPETQKRGSIHYHLLTNIKSGSELIPLQNKPLKLWNKETKKYTVIEYYNLKYWNNGFSSSYNLDLTDENFSPTKYMMKYLYKDIKTKRDFRMLKSNNLKKGQIIYFNKRENSVENYIEKVGLPPPKLVYEYEPVPTSSYSIGFKLFEQDNNTIKEKK
jgi:hypothetical protein